MFKKYASFGDAQLLEVKGSSSRLRQASLDKISDYDDFRNDDGYMYARIIAISSRVNKNNDGWPSVELAGGPDAWKELTANTKTGSVVVAGAKKDYKYGYSTFLGDPIFVDHNNSDTERTRGAIVDSKIHIHTDRTASLDPYYSSDSVDKEHLPPTKVELLLEIDAKAFPVLAKAIRNGDIDGFSMGCDVEKSKCSHCGNEASSPQEYCGHIVSKGAEHDYTSSDGKTSSRRSYENCYGIKFFEISAVFDPADETALLQELVNEPNLREAASKGSFLSARRILGENPLPQFMHTKAPQEVDTLRKEKVCPVCGEDMDGEKCDVCGHVEPPKGFDNPDLTPNQDTAPNGEQGQASPNVEGDPLGGNVPDPGQANGTSYLQSLKTQGTPQITSRLAGKINVNERPLTTSTKPATNEPKETILSDQVKPVTSSYLRDAMDMIRATKQNSGEQMQYNRRIAGEPADPSGRPDKKVDVTGVGGIMDASNEEASKPTGGHSWEPAGKTVDVDGKGGIIQDSNSEASKPNAGTQSLPTAGKDSDDAGFNKDKTTDDSGPTRTWDNSNEPDSAVTNKAFPESFSSGHRQAKPSIGDPGAFPKEDDGLSGGGSAKGGAEPADPVGKAGERVDLLQPATTPNNNSGWTDTWSGTDGNGVTRQQDPVTREVFTPFSHTVAAMKLADAEVDIGLTKKEDKYDRVAELESLTPEELAAEERVISRVRTAGLARQTKTASATQANGVTRVPSFRTAGTIQPTPQPVTNELADASLFMR